MKVLLIGGYPKGHDRPFDPATLSGNRLRRMVDETGLDAVFLDLWQTGEEEQRGKIDYVTLAIINHHLSHNVECVALGKWVYKRLALQGVKISYLPHPASRRKLDQQKLREGLQKLVKG